MITIKTLAHEVRDRRVKLNCRIIIHAPTPVRILAIDIFRHEIKIFRPPNLPIFFLKQYKSNEKFKIEDREVARASPPCLRGHIRIKFKEVLTIILMMAILTGVLVS